jgi:hypothetical protein
MANIDDHLTSNSFTHDTQLNAEVHVAYHKAWENCLVLGDDIEIEELRQHHTRRSAVIAQINGGIIKHQEIQSWLV